MTGAVFAVALAFCIWLARRSGSPALIRTGWAMAFNLAAMWAITALTDSYTPWLWFICIDFATAMVVLSNPAGRVQAYIGAIYVAQIIIHVAYGAADGGEGARLYLDTLAFGGGCQILLLATGAIHGRGRKVGRAGVGGGGNSNAAAAHLARVETRP